MYSFQQLTRVLASCFFVDLNEGCSLQYYDMAEEYCIVLPVSYHKLLVDSRRELLISSGHVF